MAAPEHDDKVICEIHRNVILVDYFIDGVHSQHGELSTGLIFSLKNKQRSSKRFEKFGIFIV